MLSSVFAIYVRQFSANFRWPDHKINQKLFFSIVDVVNSKLGMPRPQIGPSISQQGFFSSRDSLSVPCVSNPLHSYSAATSDMDLSRKNESKSTSKLKAGEQPLLSSWNPSTAPRGSIAHPTTASTSVNHLGSNNGSGVANNNADRWVNVHIFAGLSLFMRHDDGVVWSKGTIPSSFRMKTHQHTPSKKKGQFAYQKTKKSVTKLVLPRNSFNQLLLKLELSSPNEFHRFLMLLMFFFAEFCQRYGQPPSLSSPTQPANSERWKSFPTRQTREVILRRAKFFPLCFLLNCQLAVGRSLYLFERAVALAE